MGGEEHTVAFVFTCICFYHHDMENCQSCKCACASFNSGLPWSGKLNI